MNAATDPDRVNLGVGLLIAAGLFVWALVEKSRNGRR